MLACIHQDFQVPFMLKPTFGVFLMAVIALPVAAQNQSSYWT